MIAGRTTYDNSVPRWGKDGPTGAARRPVFVVTHEVPPQSPEGGVYTFVTEGIFRLAPINHTMAGVGFAAITEHEEAVR